MFPLTPLGQIRQVGSIRKGKSQGRHEACLRRFGLARLLQTSSIALTHHSQTFTTSFEMFGAVSHLGRGGAAIIKTGHLVVPAFPWPRNDDDIFIVDQDKAVMIRPQPLNTVSSSVRTKY